MSKVTITPITSDYSTKSAINTNFTNIQTALENTISRDGTSPNAMGASLDMNSNHILNLPYPTTLLEPIRRGDIVGLASGGTIEGAQLPTGGTVGSILAKKTETDYDCSWVTNLAGGGSLFNPPDSSLFSGTFSAGTPVSIPSLSSINSGLMVNLGASDSAGPFCTGVTKAPTSTSSFTITARLLVIQPIVSSTNTGSSYLGVLLTDGAQFFIGGIYLGSSYYNHCVAYYSNSDSSLWGTAYSGNTTYGVADVYIKIQYDGSSIYHKISPDGINWGLDASLYSHEQVTASTVFGTNTITGVGVGGIQGYCGNDCKIIIKYWNES